MSRFGGFLGFLGDLGDGGFGRFLGDAPGVGPPVAKGGLVLDEAAVRLVGCEQRVLRLEARMKNDDEIERLRAERDAARAEVEKVEAERILCSLAGFRVYRRDVACTGPAMKMNDNTEDQPTIDELLRAAQQVVRAINDPGVNPAYHYQQVNNLSINWPTMYRAINNLRTVLSRGLS